MTVPTELNSKLVDLNSFLCQCGCGELPTRELIALVNKIAADTGFPLTVVSGKRCEARNKAVGGAKNSQHVLGRACDLRFSQPLLDHLLANLQRYEICLEDPEVTKKGQWIHLDMLKRGTWRVFRP